MTSHIAPRAGRRGSLLATAATIALVTGGAQARAATASGDATGPGAASAPDAAVAPANAITEIVVTAQKRSESIQKIPIAVTALSGAQLQTQHVQELSDLVTIVPNVQLVTIAQTVQVNVRGVGSNFFDPRAQSSIAQSIDGLYYTRPPQSGSTFFDLSRVEVLRGPQGTLYGTNAAGGALNLITNQPVNKFQAYAEAGFGNYREREYALTVNVPITDTLAVRVAGKGLFHSGYVAHTYDDASDNAIRASAKWTPSEKLTAYFAYNLAYFSGSGNASVSYPCDPVPYSNVISARCAPPGAPGGAYQLDGKNTTRLETFQLNLTYDLGFATATSVTGRMDQEITTTNGPNGTFFNQNLDQKSHDVSEEFRLAGKDDARRQGGFAWIAGGYFSTGNGSQFYSAIGRPTILPQVPQTTYAGFAQGTYGITNSIRVTAGVRYTHDKRGVEDVNGANLQVTDSHVNFRAEAETDLTPHSLLYGSVSTGYVAGGANGGNLATPLQPGIIPPIFKPETITSYEAGTKNTFLGGTLRLNADVYYYVIKNFQSYDPGFLNNGIGPQLQIENIGDPTIYGGEIDGEFAITAADRLTFSGSLAHGTFGPLTLNSFAFGPTGPGPIVESVPSGYPVTNLPKWDAHVGYSHTFHLAQGGSIVALADSHISGSYWTVPASRDPYDRQSSFTNTALTLRYTSPGGLAVSAYVKNLENRAVTTYGENPGFHLYFPSPPRTYGMTLSYSFH